MDEATSSLDEKSENTIVERINKLRGNKTIIVITHRMNTLKYFDKVYKLENKKLVENKLNEK